MTSKVTIERETLLPCPFCGAEAEIITLEGETDNPSIGAQCVQCTNSVCGSAGGLIYPLMDDVRHLLLERWNRRTALAQKAEPPAPKDPVAQWQKRHHRGTEGKWENTDEHDAKWWRASSSLWDIRALYAAPQAWRPDIGEVVVTRNDAGEIVAVTRQDDEGRILSVIAEAQPAPSQDPALQKISDFGQDQAMTPDVLISKLANLRSMATERHVPEVDLATIDLAIEHLRFFSVAPSHRAPSHRLSDARMDLDSVEHMQGGANGPTIRLRGFINVQTGPTAPQPPIDAALAQIRPKPAEPVAWLRIQEHENRPTTIHLCDSDHPRAFKVYATPPQPPIDNAFVAEGCEQFSPPADIVNPISQQEPVAYRHSKTGQLYDSEEEVPLADGDEWAEPLYAAPVAQQEPSAWRQWSTKQHDWDYQTNRGDLRPDALAEPLFVAAAQPGAIEQALQKIADFGQEQEQKPVAWIGLPGKGTPLFTAPPAPAAVPLTDEQYRALCEAHYNDASEEYFSARPQMDSAVNRRIFYAGHRKGWLAMLAAAGDKL